MKSLPDTMQAITASVARAEADDGVSSACVAAQATETEAGADGGWRVEPGWAMVARR
ncbi:hypothetical protein [Burkholderia stagnalis]|uniref:hypothetical protein n=1 Tax=Burkholderia stagnalis TaxID=1503054 RepID=UPI0013DED635|nr:hypothetical protein [Burkholderia stagnalis]